MNAHALCHFYDYHYRESIRAHWDNVEQTMRDYLAALRDDMLFDTPLGERCRIPKSIWILTNRRDRSSLA
jgi:hypothetical protein